jgi:hypothetical protein
MQITILLIASTFSFNGFACDKIKFDVIVVLN